MKGIIAGIVMFLAGIVVMILGKMLGLVLLFVGLIFMALSYVTMMRGQGFHPNQGTINGMNGQGKQQSEVVRDAHPGFSEQPANIWDQMENQ